MPDVSYLEGDYDGLEVATPPLDVVAHLLHVDIVQRGVDLVHNEERRWSEARVPEKQREVWRKGGRCEGTADRKKRNIKDLASLRSQGRGRWGPVYKPGF